MDPQDALDEIAFRLERELASSFKSKAFRRASATIAALGAEKLQAAIDSGRLRRTPGIGETTYTVIMEAAAGGVPEYLARLRVRDGESPAAATTLRARLRGDLHSHTDWSDGTTGIETMARAAQAVGLDYLAVTDHSPRLTVANGLSIERLREQVIEVADVDGSLPDIRLLTGIEVDITEDGSLDQAADMLESLDIVVASVHSKLRADGPTMTRRMLRAIRNPHTNVLGHCTGRLVQGARGTRPESTFDAESVFAACAEHGVAVEINSRPERQDPPGALIGIALEAGCLFSIDSDAHAPGHLGFLELGAARAEAAGVPEERIVNTWPVERLLDWARG